MCNKGWKICAAPGDLTNQICPGVGNLIKMFSGEGARFDRFLKICPGFAGGGGMVTIGIAWNITYMVFKEAAHIMTLLRWKE